MPYPRVLSREEEDLTPFVAYRPLRRRYLSWVTAPQSFPRQH